MIKKCFIIDGGAGRVIASIPALLKYTSNNPQDDVSILIGGWDNLMWGIPSLQNITYSVDLKGAFERFIKPCDVLVRPEPYALKSYYCQEKSLVQAFDEIINTTDDHSDLSAPTLRLNKIEEKMAANFIKQVKQEQGKQKTVVIQPYGRSANRIDEQDVVDETSRSIDSSVYLKLVKKLAAKYNVIFFGEKDLQVPEDTYTSKPDGDLRMWAALVEASDYFVGCDSLGQHMARAFGKPGTVLIGSTFAINTSYPDHFNIIEKEGVEKVYSPIRLTGFDNHLADRINDTCMDFSDEEIEDIYQSIVSDLESKC